MTHPASQMEESYFLLHGNLEMVISTMEPILEAEVWDKIKLDQIGLKIHNRVLITVCSHSSADFGGQPK